MVQTRDDQHAVEHAIREESERACAQHCAAERVHAALEHRPAIAERRGHDQPRAPARDRHEAAAAEEGEVTRQADVGVAVVEEPRDHPGDDPGRDAQLRQLARLVCGGGEIACLAGERRDGLRWHRDQDLGALGRDQVPDDAREPRCAVVLPCETDGDADREEDP